MKSILERQKQESAKDYVLRVLNLFQGKDL